MLVVRSLMSMFAIAAFSTSATAGLITSVTSSDLTRGTVSVTQLPTSSSYVLGMTVTMLKANLPFDLVFTAPATAPNSFAYTVNMTVTNNIGKTMTGFDLVNLLGAANVTPGWSGLLNAVTPVSSYLTLQMVNGTNNYNIANGWRFGGINGGGATLLNGNSAVVSFSYKQKTPLSGGNGTTRLRFTANPEPAALLLGALMITPAIIALRRRKVS